MAIKTKRAFDQAEAADGFRVLVDRLWPRGIAKESARLDYWAKDISPSDELRKWYQHDHDEWPRFRERYFAELDGQPEAVQLLIDMIAGHDVTFVYSSKSQWNNALALKEYLENRYPRLLSREATGKRRTHE